jgi:hypothetical protein
MGMRAALQEFFGEKFFRDKVTFDKDVTFKKDVVFKRTPTLYSPVASEPSLGTPHVTSDANRSSDVLVSTSTNTAGVWSAAVTCTGAPSGAKAAYCWAEIIKVAGVPILNVEAATGYTLSDTTVGNNNRKYWGIFCVAAGQRAYGIIRIHLDANKQFKWCTDTLNSTVNIFRPIDYDC